MSRLLMLGLLGWVLSKEGLVQSAQTRTAFGYQGHLTDDGRSTDGLVDLRFQLFEGPTANSPVGSSVTNLAIQVQLGLFTTVIDFGQHPVAGVHWLEIAVRKTEGTDPFQVLLPRQPILNVPNANRADLADVATVAQGIASASPGKPGVQLSPGFDSRAPFPGGVSWLDSDGDLAGGMAADTSERLHLALTRPFQISGAPLVLSPHATIPPDLSAHALHVVGSAHVSGSVTAAGGFTFADGTRLDSANLITQANVLWVSTTGDDTTARRGDPARPWRSIGLAVSNAVSGDAVLILPGQYKVRTEPELGVLRVAAPIRIDGLTNVTLAGFGGMPEIYAPDFGDIIQILRCYNLTIRNLHLRSNASELAAPPHGQSAGICFRPDSPENSRVLIDGCRFTGVPHAITTFAAPAVSTDHLTVRDCTFIRCGWTTGVPVLGQDGGALTGFGKHLRFVNNTLDGAIRGVEFYRFPGDPGHTNALISGNIFLNYWDCAICSFDDGEENESTLDSIVITDNLFEDAPNEEPGGEQSGSAAILINSGRRITIRGNLVNRGKLYGIKVSALTGPLEFVDITANAVSDVVGRGIQVTDYGPGVRHVRVTNNRLWGNYGGGLLAQGRFLDLSFNDIAENYPAGIRLTASETGSLTSDSRVFGNTLIENAEPFMNEGLTNVVIEGNHIILPKSAEPEPLSPAPSPTPARVRPSLAATELRRNIAKQPGATSRIRRSDAVTSWTARQAPTAESR